MKTACLGFLIVGFLLSIPIGISRQIITVELNLTDTDACVTLHTYGNLNIALSILFCFFFDFLFQFKIDLSRFSNSEIFIYSVYLGNFLRDVVLMILEISLDCFLVLLLGRYVINKARLTGRQDATLSSVESTNTVIIFMLSVLSILMHMLYFLVIGY